MLLNDGTGGFHTYISVKLGEHAPFGIRAGDLNGDGYPDMVSANFGAENTPESTISVMLQVASFKLTGRRIFRMAPLHHHFELKGWPEPRVIVRFWIVTVILVLVGLASLKIR